MNNALKRPLIAHMPGHGGGSPHLKLLNSIAALDTTETMISDNLFEPTGAALEAYKLTSRLFGSRASVFSCGGATLGIFAMLLLSAGQGGTIIADRRCHKSVLHCAVLLGLDVIWISPTTDPLEPAASYISSKSLNICLAQNPHSKTVILTSPTYFGAISDIKSLSGVAHAHGATLCVDNAHGSHLIALEGEIHPISQGADHVVDSAHKTLPALTGGAYLHSNIATQAELLSAMSLFASTSPSFLIAASLDLAREYLEVEAPFHIRRFIEAKEHFGKALAERTPLSLNCKVYKNNLAKDLIFDPLRVTIKCGECDGEKLLAALAKRDIICEMANVDYLVLILPLSTDRAVFQTLLANICEIVHTCKRDENVSKSLFYNYIPKRAFSLREAYFMPRRTISVTEAMGKIAASPICPYPPGIPIIVPGEIFDCKVIEQIPKNITTVEMLST